MFFFFFFSFFFHFFECFHVQSDNKRLLVLEPTKRILQQQSPLVHVPYKPTVFLQLHLKDFNYVTVTFLT